MTALAHRLDKSGLPLYLDEETKVMALGGELKFKGMGHKEVSNMLGLLANEDGLNLSEHFYDTYRTIEYPKDAETFERYKISYDITIIMPGTVNGECKKTSGHYHGWNPEHTHTFGEVYEVIEGTAMFALQKSPDFVENPERATIEDVIYITVEAGQTLLVPPDYGHASINVGAGPLVFSNLAYTPCPVIYDSVKAHHGMSYYVLRDEKGNIKMERNPHYDEVTLPKPKLARVHDDPALGIDFSVPAYQNFVANPDVYDYLAHPDDYIDSIMALIDYV